MCWLCFSLLTSDVMVMVEDFKLRLCYWVVAVVSTSCEFREGCAETRGNVGKTA